MVFLNISKLIRIEVLISQIIFHEASKVLEVVTGCHSNGMILIIFLIK